MRHSNHRSFTSRILALLAVVSTAFAIPIGCKDIAIETGTEPAAPIYGFLPEGVSHPDIIPDHYIVVLKDGSSSTQREKTQADATILGAKVLRIYDSDVFQGFLAYLPRPTIEQVRHYEEVAWIEADRFGQRTGLQTCPGWNLDMLDHQSKPSDTIDAATMLDNVYSYDATGNGVTVLVVDTGVNTTDFPAPPGKDGFSLFPKQCSGSDPDGHGTMVAAVVAGKTTGVAKKAQVIGYNAANWSWCHVPDPINPAGTICNPMGCPTVTCPAIRPIISDDVSALEDISKKIGTPDLPPGVVVVLPHAFDAFDAHTTALEQHVRTIAKKGGIFIASAGNSLLNAPPIPPGVETSDACDFTPARISGQYPESDRIITVGGLSSDGRVGGFNTGPCVDLFAPAGAVRTRRPANACGKEGPTIESGTSYAAAHVAGVAALMLEKGVGLNGFKDSLLGMATRLIHLKDEDGLAGSPPLVLHNPYNIGESGVVDEDTMVDNIQLCDGPDCAMCLPLDGANECNVEAPKMPPPECVARMRCTGDECARCGQEGDRCCSIGNACDGGIDCLSGYCACGQKGQKCCNGSPQEKCAPDLICGANGNCADCGANNEPCCPNSQIGLCDTEAFVCQPVAGELKCVECGVPGAPCCTGGECYASDLQCLEGKCQSCDVAGAPCCNENGQAYCMGNDLQCLSGQCATCGKNDAVCCSNGGTPCVDKDVACINNTCKPCGADTQACCAENGQTYCNGSDLECVAGKCAQCGTSGADCCTGPNGSFCKGNGLSCINNTCKGCGSKDGDCCVSGGETYCSGINYQCISGKCNECGGVGQACCAGANGAYCVGAGMECINNTCTVCGVPDKPCCLGDNQPYCVGDELKCVGGSCKDCGHPGEDCCADGTCRGDMACANGKCRGQCTVRCMKGQWSTIPDIETIDACMVWAGTYCTANHFEDPVRVKYNVKYEYDLDSYFPETCGANNRYCCVSSEDTDDDGVSNKCDNDGYKCVSFPPPANASGWQKCSSCGGKNQACCTGPNLPACGTSSTCKNMVCQPCGGLNEPCCPVPGLPPSCAAGLECVLTGMPGPGPANELTCQVPVP